MKKIYNLLLLLFVVTVVPMQNMNAQVCTPNPIYTAPGIYPSDTLPDMFVNTNVSEVVDFVFPDDTIVGPLTVAFDSFLVTQVTAIPANLGWTCNVNHPTCNYIVTPGQNARGCVTIAGIPAAASPAYPGYDSIIVTGVGYVTVPIIGVQSFPNDIPVYYRIDGSVALNGSLEENIALEVSPNPVMDQSVVRYNLPGNYNVNISVFDMSGKLVHTIYNGVQAAGRHILPVSLNSQLAQGTYFVRFDLNGGELSLTKKIVALN